MALDVLLGSWVSIRQNWRTWAASEDLSHMEGLGKESLDLPCTSHCQLVFLRQLIHTQDGNDVLQVLVVLQTRASCHYTDT